MDQGLGDLRLSFTSRAEAEDVFSVISFTGREALSELYAFDLDLASSKKDPDLDDLMRAQASLAVKPREGQETVFHGVLESFAELHEADGLYFYRTVLRPRLWRLTQARRNQVFVDQDVPSVLARILEQGGLPGDAYEFRLQAGYPKRDFVCQYRETLYEFFARWLERSGMYYFFEQGPGGDKVVVVDSKIAHVTAPGAGDLRYAQTSGLDEAVSLTSVRDFGIRRTLTPDTAVLKDYDYRKPDLDLTVSASLSVKGSGTGYYYGDHYRATDEGRALAKIRTESFKARSLQAFGTSFAPGLRPGFLFGLKGHFNAKLDGQYLAVSVEHQGRSDMAGVSGLGATAPEERRPHYQNAFTAVAADVQYRSPRTRRAAIPGIMNVHVDGSGGGKYAELDDQGRYRMRLPFDQEGLADGKASAATRLTQPYAGAGFGLHCPLHKGAEAAAAFVDGNPDRPILVGAAPNPENKSPITTDNQTQCRLTTAGGHKFHIEDLKGSQRILMHSSTGDYLRIGAHNDPSDSTDSTDPSFLEQYFSKDGISLYAPDNHWLEISCQDEFLTVFGETMLNILGWYTELVTAGIETSMVLQLNFFLALKNSIETVSQAYHAVRMRIHPERNVLTGTQGNLTMADVRAAGEVTTTELSRQEAIAEAVRLSQEQVRLAGERSHAAQEVFDACQEKVDLAGERVTTMQDSLVLAQTRQDLAGQRTVLAQETVQSMVNRVTTAGQVTRTAGDRLDVAENKVETAADELAFFGIYQKN